METLSAAGFKNVEVALGKIYSYLDAHSPDELKASLDKAGLKAVSAIDLAPESVGLLLSTGDIREKYFESLEKHMKIYSMLGIELVGIGAEPAKYAFEGWEKNAVQNLRRAGDLAAEYHLKIGLEFMYLPAPVGPFVLDRVKPAHELMGEADHPNIGFFLDLFHLYNGGDTLEAIKELALDKLLNVHFLDLMKENAGRLLDADRLLPGEGNLPLQECVELLLSKGYDNYLCLELLNEEIWNMEAAKAAALCFNSMKPFEI